MIVSALIFMAVKEFQYLPGMYCTCTYANVAAEAVILVAWKREKKQTQQYLEFIRESQKRLEHESFAAFVAKHNERDEEIRQLIAFHRAPVAPPPQPSCRLPRSVIPFPQNPRFRGRQALLQSMEDSLRLSQTQDAPRVLCICGLGGVGKTQTALEFAYRNTAIFDVVLWAAADTQLKLDQAYASFASSLGLVNEEEPRARKRLQVIEDVRGWLSTSGKPSHPSLNWVFPSSLMVTPCRYFLVTRVRQR
jgi:hypothetical protein